MVTLLSSRLQQNIFFEFYVQSILTCSIITGQKTQLKNTSVGLNENTLKLSASKLFVID